MCEFSEERKNTEPLRAGLPANSFTLNVNAKLNYTNGIRTDSSFSSCVLKKKLKTTNWINLVFRTKSNLEEHHRVKMYTTLPFPAWGH